MRGGAVIDGVILLPLPSMAEHPDPAPCDCTGCRIRWAKQWAKSGEFPIVAYQYAAILANDFATKFRHVKRQITVNKWASYRGELKRQP